MKPIFEPIGSFSRRGCRRAAWICAGFVFVACGGMSGGSCNVNPTPGGTGSNTGGNNTNKPAPVVISSDHVLGVSTAPLTIVEYADFQCPFCRNFHLQAFPALKASYIDTGKVRFVFRHFPLRTIHNRAEPAAEASECANDQGAFFPYHDLLYANQSDLSDAKLKEHAVTLGLNTTDFNTCQSGTTKAARVNQDVNSGTALGVTSTPTFFVGNEVVAGFSSFDELKQVIDRKLAGG